MKTRLDKLANQAARTAKSQDVDTVHDLRVGIRRFSQGLILFPDFFPADDVKKIRKRLKSVMNLSSEVRNRDIALEHLDSSGDDLVKGRLREERTSHAVKLKAGLDKWAARDYPVRWRASLELEPK